MYLAKAGLSDRQPSPIGTGTTRTAQGSVGTVLAISVLA